VKEGLTGVMPPTSADGAHIGIEGQWSNSALIPYAFMRHGKFLSRNLGSEFSLI
jgi:hypothetical protein